MSVFCTVCQINLCQGCDTALHQRGAFSQHVRKPVSPDKPPSSAALQPEPSCQQCEESRAVVTCSFCQVMLCRQCDETLHRKGPFSKHVRQPLQPKAMEQIDATQCDQCEGAVATLSCPTCQVCLCKACDTALHQLGPFKHHSRSPLPEVCTTNEDLPGASTIKCEQCEEACAFVSCPTCQVMLCQECDSNLHRKGPFSKHTRNPVATSTAQSYCLVKNCEYCAKVPANVSCSTCRVLLCQECDTTLHQKGPFRLHVREPLVDVAGLAPAPVSAKKCERCEEALATLHCKECQVLFCPACDSTLHQKGAFRKHTREQVNRGGDVSCQTTSEQEGATAMPAKGADPTCDTCQLTAAAGKCEQCDSQFCQLCFQQAHSFGRLRTHTMQFLDPSTETTQTCEKCGQSFSSRCCASSEHAVCQSCSSESGAANTTEEGTSEQSTSEREQEEKLLSTNGGTGDPRTEEALRPGEHGESRCNNCSVQIAQGCCTTCKKELCQHCFQKTHSSQQLQTHVFVSVSLPVPQGQICQVCKQMAATVHCSSCNMALCQTCDNFLHKSKGRSKHIREVLHQADRKSPQVGALPAEHSLTENSSQPTPAPQDTGNICSKCNSTIIGSTCSCKSPQVAAESADYGRPSAEAPPDSRPFEVIHLLQLMLVKLEGVTLKKVFVVPGSMQRLARMYDNETGGDDSFSFERLNSRGMRTCGLYGCTAQISDWLVRKKLLDDTTIQCQLLDGEPGLYCITNGGTLQFLFLRPTNDAFTKVSRKNATCNLFRYLVQLCEEVLIFLTEGDIEVFKYIPPATKKKLKRIKKANLTLRNDTKEDIHISLGFSLILPTALLPVAGRHAQVADSSKNKALHISQPVPRRTFRSKAVKHFFFAGRNPEVF